MGGPARALEAILPRGAVAAELEEAEGAPPTGGLYAEELTAVADASEGRRREFAGGRACARHALELLGVTPVALAVGVDGAPLWPDGVVGSITHKGRYRAAAVAFGHDLTGLGIDAELDQRLPPGVLETIASPRELDDIERLLSERPATAWDRLLFSAKEAVVKAARRPEVGVAAGLRTVEVRFDPRDRSFSATLPPAQGATLRGAWTSGRGLLVSAAAVTGDTRAGPARTES